MAPLKGSPDQRLYRPVLLRLVRARSASASSRRLAELRYLDNTQGEQFPNDLGVALPGEN
jgi:hypothetical protein